GVSDVHHVLVSANAIESRNGVVWQCITLEFQTPAGMREPHRCLLRLSPAENRQVPRWPILDALGARVILILEIEENQMPAVARGKPRDFQVIMQQFAGLRHGVILPAVKVSLLVVVAWSPSEHTAHVQMLTCYLAIHVLGSYALAWIFVVRTACGMDVVIS